MMAIFQINLIGSELLPISIVASVVLNYQASSEASEIIATLLNYVKI